MPGEMQSKLTKAEGNLRKDFGRMPGRDMRMVPSIVLRSEAGRQSPFPWLGADGGGLHNGAPGVIVREFTLSM